jgi:hypothetical protein
MEEWGEGREEEEEGVVGRGGSGGEERRDTPWGREALSLSHSLFLALSLSLSLYPSFPSSLPPSLPVASFLCHSLPPSPSLSQPYSLSFPALPLPLSLSLCLSVSPSLTCLESRNLAILHVLPAVSSDLASSSGVCPFLFRLPSPV